MVPLLILVFGFSPKHAIPLSNFCIVGSSITNMWMNLDKRHPLVDRPLVDWDLILVMEPLTMAGAVVGAFVSKVMPDWILVSSLVVLLAFTTKTTLAKGFSQFKKETKHFEDLARSEISKALHNDEETSEREGLLAGADTDTNTIKDATSHSRDERDPEKQNPQETEEGRALAVLREAERGTPIDKVVILTTMVVVVIVLNLLKGGGGNFPNLLGIVCGSFYYWVLTALVFVWVLSISFWMRAKLIKKWQLKTLLKYKYTDGDVEWNPKNTLIYPCVCFFAGFTAGLFGIGGGIVKGPLMLQMGVHPLVASGTCAVMIMFTSVAATTMFMAFGTLTWDYAWYLFIIGLLATVVGQFGVGYLVEKYKRASLVSLSIGAVVAISTVLMGLQAIFSLIEAEEGLEADSHTLCAN